MNVLQYRLFDLFPVASLANTPYFSLLFFSPVLVAESKTSSEVINYSYSIVLFIVLRYLGTPAIGPDRGQAVTRIPAAH